MKIWITTNAGRQQFPVQKNELVVGSDPKADIQLSQTTYHWLVQLRVKEGRLFFVQGSIHYPRSRSDILLNGKSARSGEEITSQDFIQIGDELLLQAGEQEPTALSKLASDSNIPLYLLRTAACLAPKEFLQNPLVPLLLLEDPGYFQKLPLQALRALLTLPEAPAALVTTGALHESANIRALAGVHPNASEDILARLAIDPDEKVREATARNPKTPPELRKAALLRMVFGVARSFRFLGIN